MGMEREIKKLHKKARQCRLYAENLLKSANDILAIDEEFAANLNKLADAKINEAQEYESAIKKHKSEKKHFELTRMEMTESSRKAMEKMAGKFLGDRVFMLAESLGLESHLETTVMLAEIEKKLGIQWGGQRPLFGARIRNAEEMVASKLLQ
jgi:hypothetical protein